MGAAYLSNVSKQSQVSRTDISTDIQQRGNVNSVASNSIVQICGDITGNGGRPPKGARCKIGAAPKTRPKIAGGQRAVATKMSRPLTTASAWQGTALPTLPEADTEACNMEDVNQKHYVGAGAKAVQKAVLKTVSKTNLELKPCSKWPRRPSPTLTPFKCRRPFPTATNNCPCRPKCPTTLRRRAAPVPRRATRCTNNAAAFRAAVSKPATSKG